MADQSMMPADEAVKKLDGLGFERINLIPGSTYKDNSTIIIAPTRGMIHFRVVDAWKNLLSPMNQKKAFLFAVGDEVGRAYNNLIKYILSDPNLSTWKYIMTVEDDNVPPPDAHIRLLETINWGPGFDAVSGIYFTKGDLNMPQAYGDPNEYRKSGVLDFRPLDIRQSLSQGNIVEVNGIAMGCALWKMDLFRQIPEPWFVTVSDVVPGKGTQCFTQDLYFCERMKKAGKTLAVDMRVKVSHLDVQTGILY